jgi:hypothetical protein
MITDKKAVVQDLRRNKMGILNAKTEVMAFQAKSRAKTVLTNHLNMSVGVILNVLIIFI